MQSSPDLKRSIEVVGHFVRPKGENITPEAEQRLLDAIIELAETHGFLLYSVWTLKEDLPDDYDPEVEDSPEQTPAAV